MHSGFISKTFAVFMLLLCPLMLFAKDFYFRAYESYSNVRFIVFADYDGDGLEEYVISHGKGAVLVDFDDDNPFTCCHLSGNMEVTALSAMDITGNPSPEIILGIKNENHIHIEAWSVDLSFGEIVCTNVFKSENITGNDFDSNGIWDGEYNIFASVDLNDDKNKEILASVSTGYDRSDRKIIAFDVQTGSQIWQYDLPGSIYRNIFTVSQRQDVSIIFTTNATDNGNIVREESDSQSYLYCLNESGICRWKKKIGGRFSRNVCSILRHSQHDSVYILHNFGDGAVPDKNTLYELQLRQLRDGKIIRYLPTASYFTEITIADINRDRAMDVLAINRDGYLYHLSENLEIYRRTRFDSVMTRYGLGEICDLDNDGISEIILSVRNNLLIADHEFNIITRHTMDGNINSSFINHFKHQRLGNMISVLYTMNGNQIYQNAMLQVDQNPVSGLYLQEKPSFSIGILVMVFIAGVLSTLGTGFFYKKIAERTRTIKERQIDINRMKLLNDLTVVGHGKSVSSNMDRLALFIKNISEESIKKPEYMRRLRESIENYFNYSDKHIRKIVGQARLSGLNLSQVSQISEIQEKLCKNLDKIQDQTTLSAEKVKNLYITDLLEDLENDLLSLRHNMIQFYNIDVIAETRDVIKNMEQEFKDNQLSVASFRVEGDYNSRAFISGTEFEEILNELIHNSIHAMRESKDRKLSISINLNERIKIGIHDSGCGIDEKAVDKIFNRDFTSKTEGGFGLYHAKTTLEKYAGKIRVVSSIPGKGTTMEIELKSIKHYG